MPKAEEKKEESDDEEDLYAQGPTVKENDVEAINQAMGELAVDKRYHPKDVLTFFLGTEFLYLDFKSDTWQVGDVVSMQGDHSPVLVIPENTAIVRIDDKEPSVTHTTFVVIGGIMSNGNLVEWHYGVSLIKDKEALKLDVGYSNVEWNLPFPRMMHEACLVKNAKGESRIIVMGGKVGRTQATASFTKSVLGIDLKLILSPWLQEKLGQEAPKEWMTLANMNQPRSNFAHCVVNNLIYIYGGISGQLSGKDAHFPTLANPPVERYDPVKDQWEVIEIQGAPELAAFGWCPMSQGSNSIYILGGTDGSVIQEAGYIIDFAKGTCTETVDHPFEN